jgi:hypothetical protein
MKVVIFNLYNDEFLRRSMEEKKNGIVVWFLFCCWFDLIWSMCLWSEIEEESEFETETNNMEWEWGCLFVLLYCDCTVTECYYSVEKREER